MPVSNWYFNHPTMSSQQVLGRVGLRVQVEVCLHEFVQKTLSATGKPIPAAITGIALIDTGATRTSIDIETAAELGLKPIGTCRLGTAGGLTTASLFPFSIRVKGGPNLNCTRGVGVKIREQNIVALIGMDILSRCVLILNGPDGRFSICT